MKLWVLGIVAAAVLLIGLPALVLVFADDPAPAATTDGHNPAHDNPGHHFGWSEDHGRHEAGDSDSERDSDSDEHGRGGPPPWAKDHKVKGDHNGPPSWAHGDDTDTD